MLCSLAFKIFLVSVYIQYFYFHFEFNYCNTVVQEVILFTTDILTIKMAERTTSGSNGTKVFSIGRGRYTQLCDMDGVTLSSGFGSGCAGGPPTHADTVRSRGRSLSPGWSPSDQFLRGGTQVSTPDTDSTAMQHLTDMVGQLGERIGDSIVARLMSTGLTERNACSTPMTDKTVTDLTHSSAQQNTTPMIVHVKTERDPVVFRGNSSDKYSVQEWIDMTKAHMRKQSYTKAEQAEEIQGRLLGKARDVVIVALRSDDRLDVRQNPELIYDILLRYFSQSSSSLPLQDFYTTLPKPKENPVDYWIRLNKAADTADEGLRRQGRKMENVSGEVAQMFAKHCPDPHLSSILKCKPVSEWNSRDIQLRIDEYQRELRASTLSYNVPQLKSHPVVVLGDESPACNLSDSPPDVCLSCPHAMSLSQTSDPHSATVPVQQHVQRPQRASPPQLASQTEEGVLSRMMSMLEQVLTRVGENADRRQKRPSPFSLPPCKVCGDASHSTLSHCRSEHLCFKCFAPGHSKQDCPNKVPPQSNPALGN